MVTRNGARAQARAVRNACMAVALALAGSALAPAAEARDFCAAVKLAIAHAAADFAALRIAGARGSAKVQPARSLIPGGRHCEVRAGAGALEYRCRMTPDNATIGQARAAYRRDVARLRRCLAGLRARGHGDFSGAAEYWGAVSWQLPQGLRAAVAFTIAEEIVAVSDRAVADSGQDAESDETSSWIVVDKRAVRR